MLWWPGLALAIEQDLPFARGCHCTVRGGLCSLAIGVEAPRCVSELRFWAVVQDRWDWSTPTGREVTEYSSCGADPLRVCSVVSPFTLVQAHRLYRGLACGWPVVSQVLFSPGHQHRLTEGGSQHCSSHAPEPAVVAMEAAQTLAWPSPHVYLPPKPTALKPDPSQHSSFIGMFCRCWIYRISSMDVNPPFAQPGAEISSLLS